MFHLITVLDLVDEDLGGLETGYIVFVDNDRCVAGDVACDLLLPLLIDEAAKAPDVDILAARHILFHDRKECFDRRRHVSFVDSSLFCYLVNYICLRHGVKCLKGEEENF